MKRIAIALALIATPVSALEIKLDDAMIEKLGPLCQAAIFGSRMVAEPICQDLARMVQAAQKAAQPFSKPEDKEHSEGHPVPPGSRPD